MRPVYRVEPGGQLAGELRVPGDKSISHRALMLGGLARGLTEITGFLDSEDCLATLGALRALGVRIERPADHEVRVQGVGAVSDAFSAPDAPLDMGNAGTAMRLFMGLLASQRFDSTLIGDASLTRRPMERVAAPLRQMGARIETHAGCPPVHLRATNGLSAIEYAMPVASAQVKSAILLAGLGARGLTQVIEPAPTRDHTERMLARFGVQTRRDGARICLAGGQPLTAASLSVPGDFSSAAFFIVAGLLAAQDGLLLRNVGVNPTRTGLLRMLALMGADIRVHPHPAADEPVADLEVRRSRLRGIVLPPALVPLAIDELPVLFIAAACAEGETVVSGAQELRVKESDRLAVMAEGLTKLGIENALQPDGIRIRGGLSFAGGRIDSHGDHRIAMAFAVAGLRAREAIVIDDVANVRTSFPGFVELARGVGLPISEHAEPV